MCQMCDIWRHPSNDAEGERLEKLFSNPSLRQVRVLGLTGGEPFLRGDLPQIVEVGIRNLSNLDFISITSNGFSTGRIRRILSAILEKTEPAGIKTELTISVDGIEDLHNEIRGIPGVWRKVEATLDMLQDEFGDRAIINCACTVSRGNANFNKLCQLDEYMWRRGLPIKYRMAVVVQRIYNEALIEKNGVRPNTPEAEQMSKFIRERLLDRRLSWRTFFYEMIDDVLHGKAATRKLKCREMRDGGMLDSNGDLYVCSVSGHKIGNLITDRISRKEVLDARAAVRAKHCATCLHDHGSHISPRQLLVGKP